LCSQGNPAIEISDEQPESDVSDREYFGKDYFRIWLLAGIFFDSLGSKFSLGPALITATYLRN
jgi:hypothetical protein